MADAIRALKERHGSNSPDAALRLNFRGDELRRAGDARLALEFHREALAILEWNKCDALLYDLARKGREYAIGAAVTLRRIGGLMREANDFVGAAEAYKECLDAFLEALVDGGGSLRRTLLECEREEDTIGCRAALDRVDRGAVGRILSLHPEFCLAVREIYQLLREVHCVRFVGEGAASSRGRRRMSQHAAAEANLKNAVKSLSASEARHHVPWRHDDGVGGRHEKRVSFARPKRISRRAVTLEQGYDHYKELASTIVPAEERLIVALGRFPLPISVAGDESYSRRCSGPESFRHVPPVHEGRTSQDHCGPPSPLVAELSPSCVSQPLLQHEDTFKFSGS